MKLFKKISSGFLIFTILYLVGVLFIFPIALDFMEVNATFILEIFNVELAKIVNTPKDMYGSITLIGLLTFGIFGGLINSFLFYVMNLPKSKA